MQSPQEIPGGIGALSAAETPGHIEMSRNGVGWGSGGVGWRVPAWVSCARPGPPSSIPVLEMCSRPPPSSRGYVDVTKLESSSSVSWVGRRNLTVASLCGVILGTALCTRGCCLELSPPPFAFLTEVCPSPPPHLVLADKGSTSSLSSPEVSHQPQESSPHFATLLLHLEAIRSHRAAMFFLGKGVEGSGWASQLSSASKPALFPPPLSRPTSKKALSALLGQFHRPAGQKYPGDPPSLAGWSSHPFPTPTLSWRDFPLPAWSLPPSCKEARHRRGGFFWLWRGCSSRIGGVG